jgi:hypothetical protein
MAVADYGPRSAAVPFTSPLFSVCPRVVRRRGKLVASTAWRMRILTLGALYREVVIDPKGKVIRLRHRFFWFLKRAVRVPFGSVKAITYGYWGNGGARDWWWGAQDTKDAFCVGLRLTNFEELHLFWFYGDGPFANYGPFPDWLYWQEYLFDLRGTQETESRLYAEMVSRLIGAPVEPPST